MSAKKSKSAKSPADQGGNLSSSFIPAAWEPLQAFLTNFLVNLTPYKTLLGITDEEIAKLTAIKNNLTLVNASIVALENYLISVTAFRKNYWSRVSKPISFPSAIVVPEFGNDLESGNLKWFSELCARIKTNTSYTEEIGKALGIVRQTVVLDPSKWQPVVVPKISGGRVKLSWRKGNSDAALVECDKTGDGVFGKGDTVLSNSFTEELVFAPGQTNLLWKYRVTYIYKDQKVGLPSETVAVIYAL